MCVCVYILTYLDISPNERGVNMVMSIVRYETSSGYLKLIRYTNNPNSQRYKIIGLGIE